VDNAYRTIDGVGGGVNDSKTVNQVGRGVMSKGER